MIHISKMSGKLAGIDAINTNTCSNEFCQRMQKKDNIICSKCYSQNMLTTFRQCCVPAFQRNSDAFEYVQEGATVSPKTDLFRFSAHGELVSNAHYISLCNIARENPETMFSLWTKRAKIVKKYYTETPYNMLLIYSNPVIDHGIPAPPKYFDKVFNTFTKGFTEDINCGSNKCVTCQICYSHNDVEVINEEIK